MSETANPVALTTTSSSKVEDAGEVLPNARKHTAVPTGRKSGSIGPKLADLFPEPDWKQRIQDGMDADCAAYLSMVYDALPTTAKPHGYCRVSGEEWAAAYEQALMLIAEFFDQVRTLDAATKIRDWFATRFDGTPASIAKRPPCDHVVYWSVASGGRRNLYPVAKFTLRQHYLSLWLPKLGWPLDTSALRQSTVPVLFHGDGVPDYWRIAHIKGDVYYWKSERIDSEEEAIAQCMTLLQHQQKAAAAVRRRTSSVDQTRRGPDVRSGSHVTGDELLAEFGLRGLQFGEWVPNAERQGWLDDCFDGLADLADVLGVPRRWIGLGGLGLAIGARGASAALAHYEPGLRVINVTRLKGSGSIAHEWFHAFDHRLARRFSVSSLIRYCCLRPWFDCKSDIESEFLDLWNRLKNSEFKCQAERIERLPRSKKAYWTQPEELGARSFEAWVEDTLQQRDMCSPCLVHGTLEADHAEHEKESPYPNGDERVEIGLQYGRIALHLQSLIAAK